MGLPNICRNIFDVDFGLFSKKALSETISTVKKNSQLSIEVHVINEDINLYGKNIILKFKDFLRLESKFKSEDDLAKQIKKDILKVI